MKHFLSVGGTGMLAHATVELAGKSAAQTVVARHASRFVRKHALAQAVAIDADWADASFLERLAAALGEPPDLAVLWRAPDGVFALLDRAPCRVIHVLGTGAGDLAGRIARLRESTAPLANVRHLFVALGSKPTATGRRWLHHDEISGGVLECERTSRDVIVGEAPD